MSAFPIFSIQFLILTLCASAALLPSAHLDSKIIPRDDVGSSRNVFVQFTTKLQDVDKQGVEYSLDALDTRDIRGSIYHAALEVQGDGVKNGNIRIEIDLFDGLHDNDPIRHAVRVRDYGLGNPQDPPSTRFAYNRYIKVFNVGTTQLSNEALLDTNGRGVVSEVWSPNRMYSTLTNNCIKLVGDVLTKMGVAHPPYLANVFAETNIPLLMYSRHGRVVAQDVPVRLERYAPKGNPDGKEAWAFDVTDSKNPQLLVHTQGGNPIGSVATIDSVVTGTDVNGDSRVLRTQQGFSDFFGRSRPTELYVDPPFNPFADTSGSQQSSPRNPFDIPLDLGGDERPSSSTSAFQASEKTSKLTVAGPAEIAVVRTGGVLKNVLSVAEKSATVLGIGGIIASSTFIILDIINGDFKAAAFAAAGIALEIAGIALDLLATGPIGTIVGLVAGILFAILPGLISSYKSPAPTNNPAQIIQFAYFGDKDHTGNEACNKQRSQQGLSQNCTALYGAGVLSKIFKWNNFDSAAFLLEYNSGHAMSIIDIAAAFQVKDYSQPDWGSDVKASIDCGPFRAPSPPPGVSDITAYNKKYDFSPRGGYACKDAKFMLQRKLIKLSQLNVTADNIYGRIIPAPGGDCKILSDPIEGVQVPFFDLTVTGRPVAIACNLTADSLTGIDPNANYTMVTSSNANLTTYSSGTVLTYNPSTNSTSNVTYTTSSINGSIQTNTSASIYTTANVTSTDGSASRAYQAPPPPVAFTVYNDTNSVCLSSPGGRVCLPNGTYGISTGAWGGYSTKGANGLSSPDGAGVSFDVLLYDVKDNPSPYDVETNSTVFFFENITAGASSDFSKKMNLEANYKNPFNVFVSPLFSKPGACLHSQKNFLGDVQCFGLGGTNLTGPVVAQTSSLSLRGNASAWVYGEKYGDLGGVQVTRDVADLATLPYGSERNFDKQIRAMWIRLPS
ncbi:MAG: hypothetical protein M1814_005030 [Vezdaea aestivalis]|nr:MAG: hypothetical protein M1814_005030 [Vezdaea aestivalis]